MASPDKTWSYPDPVTLTLRDETFQVKPGIDLRAALSKIGVPSESVLAIRSGVMITDDELLLPGDHIKLVHVISGG